MQEKSMSLEIGLDDVDPHDLIEALDRAGVHYNISRRHGFDGVAAATLVIDSIAALGTILTPIILHFVEKKEKSEGQITINAIVITDLRADQVEEVIRGLIRDDRPPRPDL